MTAYTTHADAIFEPDKPNLGSTHSEARDNLISVAEGGSGAPKIADKTVWCGTNTTTTISGVGPYGGVWMYSNGSADTTFASVEFSNNGTTYYGSTTIFESTAGEGGGTGMFFVDFSSAAYKLQTCLNSTGGDNASASVSGLSASVTHIKVVTVGACSVIARLNGGESSS